MRKTGLIVAAALVVPVSAWGGAFLFTESEFMNQMGDTFGPFPDLVTHPQNYEPETGGMVTVQICITSGSPNGGSMQVPLQNIIDRYNLFVPATPNVRSEADSEPLSGEIDWESVALHEIGHCIGLNHPNAASESCDSGTGLCGDGESNYTKALPAPDTPLDGNQGQLQGDPGIDSIIGSPDDVRGDDVNLHYFEIGVNNPFAVLDIVDSINYSRDLDDLPEGDTFAANADFTVGRDVYGFPNTEAVMQQGTFPDETQRALAADDVATLRYARSGIDRLAGAGTDDYTVELEFEITNNPNTCDITVEFDDMETGFAVCNTRASADLGTAGSEAAFITQADVFFNDDHNWHFSTFRIPFPGADQGSVTKGGSTSAVNGEETSLLANDTHPTGLTLAMSTAIFGGPDHGAVTLNTDGTFTYTHNGDAAREDAFVYEVCVQDQEACAHQVVTIAISAFSNLPPDAMDDSLTVDEGGTATTLDGGADSVLANDSDPEGGNLTVDTMPVTAPANGALTLNADGTFEYIHDGSETTSDSFVYEVCDNGSPQECSQATVAITITLNDPPEAVDDSLTVDEGGTATMLDGGADSVLANDSDPEGGNLTVDTVPVTAPANGALTLNADGTFEYVHDGSETTSDSFVYQVCDDGADPECSQATVAITVTAVNDPPVAVDDEVVVFIGGSATATVGGAASLLANDSDPDSDNLVAAQVTNPTAGTASVNADGTFNYTHTGTTDGSDSFDYQVCDDNLPPACDTGAVLITISPPFAQCSRLGRRVVVGVPVSIDAASEFSGAGLTFSATGLPASLSIDSSSGFITGTPVADDATSSPFTVTVSASDGTDKTFVLEVDATADAIHFSSFEGLCFGL